MTSTSVLRNRLVTEKKRIMSLLEICQASCENTKKENDNEDHLIAVSTHIGDIDTFLDINGQRLLKISKRLSCLNRALSEIEKGNYGICIDCEEEIPSKRLIAQPGAKRCVECQNKKEELNCFK